MHIHKLGQIDLPSYIYDDIQTEPNRKKSQVHNPLNRRGKWLEDHDSNITAEEVAQFESYYTDDNCYSVSWKYDHYVDIVPENFRNTHNLSKPVNAIIRRQLPGKFFAPHKDFYDNLVKKDIPDATIDEIRRLWIPLHDWEFGHALFVGNEVLTHWKAGEVYWFPGEVIHSGCNAGLHARYTLLVYTILNRD